MKTFQVIVLVAAVSLSAAFPLPSEGDNHENHEKPKPYKFEYSVHDSKTKDVKEAMETSDGHTVKGYYKLKEADGTTRIVHYTADKHNGFTAHVEKIGHAEHPEKYEVHIPHVPEPSLPDHSIDTDSDVVIHYDPEIIHHYTAEVVHHDDDESESEDHQYEPSEIHEVTVAETKQESGLKHDFTVVHDKQDSTSYQSVTHEEKDKQ